MKKKVIKWVEARVDAKLAMGSDVDEVQVWIRNMVKESLVDRKQPGCEQDEFWDWVNEGINRGLAAQS